MIKAKTVKNLADLPLALAREYQTFQKQKTISNRTKLYYNTSLTNNL